MTLFGAKNTVLLASEINRLNNDIIRCEENLSGKKVYCTPSCCCYCLNNTMSKHKNYVSITRKKCDNNTITKLGIIPRCNNLKETCITERSVVDVVVKKSPFTNRKRSSRNEVPKKVDAATDPILFSSKDKSKYKDYKWEVILNDGNLNRKKSNYKYRRPVKSIQSSSDSTSTSDFPKQMAFHNCFNKKNVGVQCNFRNKINIENSPIHPILIILERLKEKLKDDCFMRNKLYELENELQKLFGFNTNLQSSSTLEENNTCKNYSTFLTSTKSFSPPSSEIDHISLLKLDETCRDLENTCFILKKERDSSLQILAEKSAELMDSKMREADIKNKFIETDSKIKEFSAKIVNYGLSVKTLGEHVNKLQNENKELKKLEQQMTNLNGILKTVMKNNTILLTELNQVTNERNKLQLALNLNEELKIQPESVHQSSTKIEDLCEESNASEEFKIEEKSNSSLTVTKSSSSTSKSSPPLISSPLPSLFKSNSVKISSLSDNQIDQFEEGDKIMSNIDQQSTNSQHQTKFNLNKIKEEVNNIFAEIKQLNVDIPSKPVFQLKVEDFSSDFSEINSTSSGKDIRQPDFGTK